MSVKCKVQAQLLMCSRPDSQTLSWSKSLGLRRRIKVSSMQFGKDREQRNRTQKAGKKKWKRKYPNLGSLKWYNGLRRAWVNEVCGHM